MASGVCERVMMVLGFLSLEQVAWVFVGLGCAVAIILAIQGGRWIYWFVRAKRAGVKVGVVSLLMMGIRRVKGPRVLRGAIAARELGWEGVGCREMETHLLAGGDLDRVLEAKRLAEEEGMELRWEEACAFDLGGRDLAGEIRRASRGEEVERPKAKYRLPKTGMSYEEELEEIKRLKTLCLKCGFSSTKFWPFCPKCFTISGVTAYRPLAVTLFVIGAAWGIVTCVFVLGYLFYPSYATAGVQPAVICAIIITAILTVGFFPEFKKRKRHRLKQFRIWHEEFCRGDGEYGGE